MKSEFRVGHWLVQPDVGKITLGTRALSLNGRNLVEALALQPGVTLSSEVTTKVLAEAARKYPAKAPSLSDQFNTGGS